MAKVGGADFSFFVFQIKPKSAECGNAYVRRNVVVDARLVGFCL